MWRYTLLTTLLAVPVLLHTLWQALRFRDARYFRERMGLYAGTTPCHSLWIHAASVGEVNAVMPLIHALQQRHPQLAITLTTSTPSGGSAARRQLPATARQHYLPFDWGFAVRNFLRYLQPNACLIMETELWPRLYQGCADRQIPITIINGRISPRTLRASPWMRELYAQTLRQVQHILARSDTDRARFIDLGANAETINTLGNIKFARPGGNSHAAAILLPRPYLLAASTREGEELQILRAWNRIDHGDRLLVMVPRHPQRLAGILRELQPQEANIAVRSRNDEITTATQLYIADTFGELGGFIAGADLVVMGGSLEPFGGQNLLEVARAGKALIFGPHMENFADEAQLLLEHEAAIQVHDEHELRQVMERVLADAAQRQQMGASGKALMEQRAHIVDDYLDALQQIGVLK